MCIFSRGVDGRSHPPISPGWKSLWRFPPCELGSEVAHHPSGEAEYPAPAGQLHQLHLAALPRLEAHRGAGRDVQAHAAGGGAVELQGVVGLEEVVVRADLDRPVAAVGHVQGQGAAAGVELDLAVGNLVFAGDHGALRSGVRISCMKVRSSQRPNLRPTWGICPVMVKPRRWCRRIEAALPLSMAATITCLSQARARAISSAISSGPRPLPRWSARMYTECSTVWQKPSNGRQSPNEA